MMDHKDCVLSSSSRIRRKRKGSDFFAKDVDLIREATEFFKHAVLSIEGTLHLHIRALGRIKKSFTLSSVTHGYYENTSSTNEAYLLLVSYFHDISKSTVIVFNTIHQPGTHEK